MSRDELPEPWRSALERKGISSKRGLAAKAGISPQTAKRLIDGIGNPSAETVSAVADLVFGGDRTLVWELAGKSRQDFGPWALPPEASQLDPEQRAAVLAVVRAMLPAEARGGEHGGDTAATNDTLMSAGSGKTAAILQHKAPPKPAEAGADQVQKTAARKPVRRD